MRNACCYLNWNIINVNIIMKENKETKMINNTLECVLYVTDGHYKCGSPYLRNGLVRRRVNPSLYACVD